MEAYIRNTARDKAKYILRSEHESLLKAGEDELVTDMRKQLVHGYVVMRHRTVEAVELYHTEHREDSSRLEEDRQHFVGALSDSTSEVTSLRNKHLDYGEWEMTRDTTKKARSTMIWTNGIEPMPAIQMRLALGLSVLTNEFDELLHPSEDH